MAGREGEAPVGPPERLAADHDLTDFRCGRDELDDWLRRHARRNEGETSRTYVVPRGRRVVGYYCLAAGSVMRDALPRRMRHDTPEQVPIVVLGRLASDMRFQRRGLGRGMVQEAILRTLRAAEEIGVRALLVHALDDEAAGFYARFDFIPCPLGERTLVLSVETARRSLLPG